MIGFTLSLIKTALFVRGSKKGERGEETFTSLAYGTPCLPTAHGTKRLPHGKLQNTRT